VTSKFGECEDEVYLIPSNFWNWLSFSRRILSGYLLAGFKRKRGVGRKKWKKWRKIITGTDGEEKEIDQHPRHLSPV